MVIVIKLSNTVWYNTHYITMAEESRWRDAMYVWLGCETFTRFKKVVGLEFVFCEYGLESKGKDIGR